jgi:NitT/TauT family transport system substrate-binding protein
LKRAFSGKKALRVVFGGPEIAAAYDSGHLKIGELGTPPGLTAIGKGARFKIVGSSVRRGAVQYFVARPEIDGWKALAGRRLGVLTIGSCSYWFMREVVSHHGLDPDSDVEIVGLGPRYPKVVDLVSSGALAGAIISEPNVSIGEAAGGFKV